MKTYRVQTHPDAEADVRSAIHYIAVDSPANAVAYLDGLEKAILSLKNFPERAVLAPESQRTLDEVRQRIYKSHRILFTVRNDTVHVLHVRHTSQRELDQFRQPPKE